MREIICVMEGIVMGQKQGKVIEISTSLEGNSGESKLSPFIIHQTKLMDLLISLLYMGTFGGRVLLAFPDQNVKVS